ncbi:MAG: phytanoyl-CoA dioxygenase family protein [Solirubrobacterales bacterium]|nr:phytanoyl-CoA dioxygenase family protein [Solirubrobacterales bacterium]
MTRRTGLSPERQERYARTGYLFPFTVLTAAELAAYRSDYERLEPHLGDPPASPLHAQCHMHFRWAFELATRPSVLDLVEDLIGHDILVHTTTLFRKRPRDPAFVSWHQDDFYWGLDAPSLVSAWVALSDSTTENGCMRVLPGTHRRRLPHEERPNRDNMLRAGLQLSGEVDESEAVDFVLEAGQASLHHAQLVHGSRGNRSDRERIGFAIRYVSPAVHQQRPHHAVVLARGKDEHGNYELLERPPSPDFEQALAAHLAFWESRPARPADRPPAALAPEA